MISPAPVELDLAYLCPDPESQPQDPVGEKGWNALLSQWLGALQEELPAELQAEAYSLGLQFCDDAAIAQLNGAWRTNKAPKNDSTRPKNELISPNIESERPGFEPQGDLLPLPYAK